MILPAEDLVLTHVPLGGTPLGIEVTSVGVRTGHAIRSFWNMQDMHLLDTSKFQKSQNLLI